MPHLTPRTGEVVFVSDRPMAREAKLAHGLKQLGWRVVLLHRYNPNFSANALFDELLRYDEPDEAVSLAGRFDPVAYHVFANWQFDVAAAVVRAFGGSVVFDDYDVMGGMVDREYARQNYPGQWELERICLEQAAGLCCRDLETQYPRRRLGYRYGGRRIFVPDGCWAAPLQQVDRPDAVDELHVAYCGNIGLEKYTEGAELETCVQLWLAETLAAQGVHYHLFPSRSVGAGRPFEEAFSDYLELAERTPYFHLYRSVPADQLTDRLARCHLGILVLSRTFEAPRGEVTMPVRYAHASSNKVFDYLDAGLAVLVNRCNPFIHFLLRRYGASTDATRARIEDLRGQLGGPELEELLAGAVKARQEFAITRHAERLACFYHALPRARAHQLNNTGAPTA